MKKKKKQTKNHGVNIKMVKQGITIICEHCGYQWISETRLGFTTCTNCQLKTRTKPKEVKK